MTEDVLVGRTPANAWGPPSVSVTPVTWAMGGFTDPAAGTTMESSMLPPPPPGQKPPSSGVLPLLTPKPDTSFGTGSSDGHAGLTFSGSGLTSSRDNSPKGLLARINLLEQTIDGQLKSLKYLQSNLMEELGINPHINQTAEVNKVQQIHEEVSRHLTNSIDTLTNLNDTQLLAAADAHKLAILMDKLDLHTQRLRIYQEELNNALSGRPYVPTAALIITQQPFPCTIKQGKSIDEPVEITLLTGAKVEIQKMGPVKAEMLNEEATPSPKKKSTEPPIQNGVQVTLHPSLPSLIRLCTEKCDAANA